MFISFIVCVVFASEEGKMKRCVGIAILFSEPSVYTFCRVFYFLDIITPTKMEIKLHEKDDKNPPHYGTEFLHTSLTPTFKNGALNSAKYELYTELGKTAVYFYNFEKTTPASSATYKSLEMSRINDESDTTDIVSILPSCDIFFEPFPVPRRFMGEPDVIVLVQKATEKVQKAFQLLKDGVITSEADLLEQIWTSPEEPVLNSLEETNPVVENSHTPAKTVVESNPFLVCGNEDVRNQRLAIWLQQELKKHLKDYTYVSGSTSDETKISRFSGSEEDFGFFVQKSRGQIEGASVSVFNPVENCELKGVSGDNKELAKESDKYQVIANMIKNASDVAKAAVSKGYLFKTITIYGLLVDYCSAKVVKTYKLEFDFESRKSALTKCDKTELELHDAFSRVTHILKA